MSPTRVKVGGSSRNEEEERSRNTKLVVIKPIIIYIRNEFDQISNFRLHHSYLNSVWIFLSQKLRRSSYQKSNQGCEKSLYS